MIHRPGPILPALAILLLSPVPALANGQTSHLWITEEALELLPEGELRAFLGREDLRPMLRNGSMFPDGGYAVGDGYGEIAHWEPFHNAYMDWIVASFDPPWSDEAARHIAFWIGMASHGMADQVYDSMYMERARVYDADSPWDTESMDEATDVALAAEAGAQEVPEFWVPAAELAPLFLQASGHAVEADTIETGQAMLGFAVYYVGEAAQNPDALAEYQAQFPWATAHQLDRSVAGSPPLEAEVVARYWQVLWERLGGAEDLALIDGFPRDGDTVVDGSLSIEAMVSVVLGRGLTGAVTEAGAVVVHDTAGDEHPVEVRLFYGHGSHVLNVRPSDPWRAGETYSLTLDPPPESFDGVTAAAPVSFTFDAREPPDLAVPDPGSCTCRVAERSGGSPLALLAPCLALLTRSRRARRRRGRVFVAS